MREMRPCSGKLTSSSLSYPVVMQERRDTCFDIPMVTREPGYGPGERGDEGRKGVGKGDKWARRKGKVGKGKGVERGVEGERRKGKRVVRGNEGGRERKALGRN